MVLIFILGGVLFLLNFLSSHSLINKTSPFEAGFESTGSSYYVNTLSFINLAVLFLLMEVEMVVLLFNLWNESVLFLMLCFYLMGTLMLERKKSALIWKN